MAFLSGLLGGIGDIGGAIINQQTDENVAAQQAAEATKLAQQAFQEQTSYAENQEQAQRDAILGVASGGNPYAQAASAVTPDFLGGSGGTFGGQNYSGAAGGAQTGGGVNGNGGLTAGLTASPAASSSAPSQQAGLPAGYNWSPFPGRPGVYITTDPSNPNEQITWNGKTFTNSNPYTGKFQTGGGSATEAQAQATFAQQSPNSVMQPTAASAPAKAATPALTAGISGGSDPSRKAPLLPTQTRPPVSSAQAPPAATPALAAGLTATPRATQRIGV